MENEKNFLANATKRLFNNETFIGYLFIFPIIIWIVGFVIYPLINTIQISFNNQHIVGTRASFVWFSNYISLLKDPVIWSAFGRSIFWTIGNAVFQGILGLGVALLLNKNFRGRNLIRTWLIFPWIIPTVVLAIQWKWLLSSTYGVINYILSLTGIIDKPLLFLASPDSAMWTAIGINVWRWFPFLTIVVYSALQNIPPDIYEAAIVDGVNGIQKFFYITFPLIQAPLMVMSIFGMIFSFNLFDVIWLLTEGGPAHSTMTLPVIVYRQAFRTYFISEAAALGVIMVIFLIILLSVFIKLDKKTETDV